VDADVSEKVLEILASNLPIDKEDVYRIRVLDQHGRCPLTVFVRQLCWEINQAMGVSNDEDRGFRRVDEMCAAKPLGRDRFKEE
jgi:hypothetical protein